MLMLFLFYIDFITYKFLFFNTFLYVFFVTISLILAVSYGNSPYLKQIKYTLWSFTKTLTSLLGVKYLFPTFLLHSFMMSSI